jgi:glucokinase
VTGEEISVGVDLGGTKIQVVVLRGDDVAGSARMLTPQTGDPGDVIDEIVRSVVEALSDADIDGGDVGAIGVGSPGQIEHSTGAVLHAANVPGFEARVELGGELATRLRAPVSVGNDVSVGVLGEYRLGAGRPYRDVLGVWLGTGVGGGLILGGELRTGRGSAGEFGHIVAKPGGRRCTCGNRGCVEAYAGRASMERRAKALVARGHETILFKTMERRGRTRLTSGVYQHALEHGDEMATMLIEDAARATGIGMASAQNLLDFEAIIIGGGLGDRLGKSFARQVAQHMEHHLFARETPPDILTTELGDLGGAVGAALAARG